MLFSTPMPTAATHRLGTPGLQPSAGARWLLQGQDALACIAAWQAPHGLAPIRTGAPRFWEAISVQTLLGEHALHVLAGRTTPGPVLSTGVTLVFLVPALHHDWATLLTGIEETPAGPWNWGAGLTAHLGQGSEPLPCPQPGIPHRKGPRWIVEPDGCGTLTLTGQLADALHSAHRTAIAPAAAEQPAQDRPHPRPTRPANLAAFVRRQPSNAEGRAS